ncbi:hypothetical protein KJ780_02880, partial [Candidatus Micrarchaeota archaeon]|nr:hypothetical protein [Candidatus Micrarchaeota archaeon]
MGRCGKAIVLAGIATALVVGIPNSTVFSRSQDLKSRAEKAFVVNEKREGSILPNSVKNVSDKKEKVGVVQRLVDGLSIKKCYAGENKDSTNRSPDGIF